MPSTVHIHIGQTYVYLRESSCTWCDPCKGATEACKGFKRQQGCTALPAPLGGRHSYPKLLPPSPCPRACGDAERQHKILAGSPCMASPLLNAGQAAAGSCRRAKGRAGLPSGSTDLPRAEIALDYCPSPFGLGFPFFLPSLQPGGAANSCVGREKRDFVTLPCLE